MTGDTNTLGCFQSIDLPRFREALAQLHQVVLDGKGRIEVRCEDRNESCILISKSELESLERALEILSETAGYEAMCAQISQLAASAGPTPCA